MSGEGRCGGGLAGGKRYRIAWAACLAALLGAAFVLSFFRVIEPDVFWQLKTGQILLETGRLVRTNLFASTFPEYPWHNHEWLHEVALALAYAGAGWPGITLLKVCLIGLTAALLYVSMTAEAGNPLLAASLIAVALSLMRFRFTERPQIFSFVLMSLTLSVVHRHRQRGGRVVWLLPFIYLLWSNIHPEFILGLLYLLGVIAGEGIGAMWARRPPGTGTRRLAASFLLCLPATLLNPEGYRPLVSAFAMGEIHQVMAVNEYLPSSFAIAPLFWIMAGATALVLLLRWKQWDWAEVIPLVGMALIGGRYVRSTTFFALTAVPTLHRHLASWCRRGGSLRNVLRVTVVTGAAAALLWALRFNHLLPYRWGWGMDDASPPVAAADFLVRERPPGTLYNHYNQGGYLIYRLYPLQGVFQDSRFQPYPRQFMNRLQSGHSRQEFNRLFEEFRVNTALVKAPEIGLLFSGEEWGLVFWDDTYAVLVRRIPATQALLDRLEYLYFIPGDRSFWNGSPEVMLRVLEEMKRNQAQRLHPSWMVARDMGIVLGQLRQYGEAEEMLRRATDLAPGEASVWAYLGRAYAEQGKREKAMESYRRSLSIEPGQTRTMRWMDDLKAR